MSSWPGIRGIVALCGAVALYWPEPAQAAAPTGDPAQVAEAQVHYKRGLELYQEGNGEGALIELRRAYEIVPSYKVLYNIAQVEFATNDYASALAAFEKYLADGGSEIAKKRQEEVSQEIGKLRSRVARVEISVNVEGAAITVDDNPPMASPLSQPLVLNAGRHKISTAKAGYSPDVRTFEVAGGDTPKIAVELREAPAETPKETAAPPPPLPPPAAPPSAPPPPAPVTESSPPVWIGWVATGALATGAVVLGVLASSAASDLSDERGRFGATHESLDSKQSKVKTLALASDVCSVGAIVAGGVTLYFTLSSNKTPENAGTVALGIGPMSARLEGNF